MEDLAGLRACHNRNIDGGFAETYHHSALTLEQFRVAYVPFGNDPARERLLPGKYRPVLALGILADRRYNVVELLLMGAGFIPVPHCPAVVIFNHADNLGAPAHVQAQTLDGHFQVFHYLLASGMERGPERPGKFRQGVLARGILQADSRVAHRPDSPGPPGFLKQGSSVARLVQNTGRCYAADAGANDGDIHSINLFFLFATIVYMTQAEV